ncbi:MAG: DUF6076 domain-containing protein [Clostridia bacterium]|nr:DUF6076 domain-containing protein [Clostridia bacterium]
MNSDYTLIWGEYEDLELQGSIFFNHKTHMEKIVFDDGFGEIIFEVDEPTGTSLVRFLNFDIGEVKRLKANVLNSVINFLDNETLYDIAIRLDVVDIFDDNDALKEIIDLLKTDKVANTSSKRASVFLYNDLMGLIPYYSDRKRLVEVSRCLKKQYAELMEQNIIFGYILNNTLMKSLEYTSNEIEECVEFYIDDEMYDEQMPFQIWTDVLVRVIEQIMFYNDMVYYHKQYTEYANYFFCKGFKPYLDELDNEKRAYLYLLDAENDYEMLSEAKYSDFFNFSSSRIFIEEDNIKFRNMSVEERVEKIKECSIDLLEIVKLNNIECWLDSSVTKMIEYDIKLKRCENCGRYFIPFNRSDTMYCDEPAPQNPKKTCKEFASQELSYKKLKSDPIRDLRRKIYQQKEKRATRNPNLEKFKIDFENFKTESKKKNKEVKNGTLTETEYLKWLNEEKNKEV